jgi:2'-5' RNA ligase
MYEMVRTFVAVDLSKPLREALVKIQNSLSGEGFRIRWVKSENIHLTLVFLGDVHSGLLNGVHLAIVEAVRPYSPINLSATGVGVFPGIKRPRVIWVGLSGALERFYQLRSSVVHSLARVEGLAYEVEKRPFRAHLTLGRVKGRIDSRKLARAIERFQGKPSEPLTVDVIHVFKSDLQPGGASYTKLHSIRLV